MNNNIESLAREQLVTILNDKHKDNNKIINATTNRFH